MAENNINTKLSNKKDGEDNTIDLDESSTPNSTDKFDWDFILEREWSRTKK